MQNSIKIRGSSQSAADWIKPNFNKLSGWSEGISMPCTQATSSFEKFKANIMHMDIQRKMTETIKLWHFFASGGLIYKLMQGEM